MADRVDLSKYTTGSYSAGAGMLKRLLWYYVNALFFRSSFNPVSGLKVMLLRLFGARIGSGVVIKPSVNIKSPWLLYVGDHTWIGENVWIDNLVPVKIGSNVCLSQGAMLLTGNHNYKSTTFDLITGKITLEEGVWIGAKAIVCPGVTCHSHSVLTVNSVTSHDLEKYKVYSGNPAKFVRKREFND